MKYYLFINFINLIIVVIKFWIFIYKEDDYTIKYQKEIEEFNAEKDHTTMTKKKKNRGKKKDKNEVLIKHSYGEKGEQLFIKPNDTA